jgi:hypothetical protein
LKEDRKKEKMKEWKGGAFQWAGDWNWQPWLLYYRVSESQTWILLSACVNKWVLGAREGFCRTFVHLLSFHVSDLYYRFTVPLHVLTAATYKPTEQSTVHELSRICNYVNTCSYRHTWRQTSRMWNCNDDLLRTAPGQAWWEILVLGPDKSNCTCFIQAFEDQSANFEKGTEMARGWTNCIIRSFEIYNSQWILEWSNQDNKDEACSTHLDWEMCTYKNFGIKRDEVTWQTKA